MMRRTLAGVILAALALFAGIPATAQAQDQRCFDATGYCISGSIRTYWERNGGLAVFGYPITAQRVETVEGRTIQVQWFERDRLEIQADGSITAGRLGARLLELQGRPWESFAKDPPASANQSECSYFTETGFSLCLSFRTYWQNNGGLARFGYPISPVMGEEIEGKIYSVQYFERRRIELHPENNPPYNLLLGLLGREVLKLEGNSQPVTTPLAGTTWQWVRLTDPGQQVTIQNPERYTIQFADASNLSITADCNSVRGNYTAGNDGKLSITITTSTRVACPPGSRGDEFTGRLGAAARWFTQNGHLFIDLMADGGTLEFAPSGGSSSGGSNVTDGLSGTSWRWVRLSDPGQRVDIQNPDSYTVSFSNGDAQIKADCNTINGYYSVGANQTITITLGASTTAACPAGSRGDQFASKLAQASRFYFQNNALFLELPADGGTLQFERQ